MTWNKAYFHVDWTNNIINTWHGPIWLSLPSMQCLLGSWKSCGMSLQLIMLLLKDVFPSWSSIASSMSKKQFKNTNAMSCQPSCNRIRFMIGSQVIVKLLN